MTEVQPARLSLRVATERFLAELAGLKAPGNTVTAYGADLRLWANWLAGETIIDRLDQLERWNVGDYVAHVGRAGLEASTIRRKLAAIKHFCTWCVDSGYLTADPAQNVRGPKMREREALILSTPEYKALLFEASGDARDYAIMQTFLQTGVRECELCALTLADVDLLAKEVRVRDRKGGVDTVIPLSQDVLEALRRYLAVRPAADTDRLFVSKSARPLTTRVIRWLVKKYLGRAKILVKKPEASVHTLRHTFGAHKTAKGADIATVQYWMGHKKKETTFRYIHLVKTRNPDLMEATSL